MFMSSPARRINIAPCFIDLLPQCSSFIRRQAIVATRLTIIAVAAIVVTIVLAPVGTTSIVVLTLASILRKKSETILIKRLSKHGRASCETRRQHQNQSQSFQCNIHFVIPGALWRHAVSIAMYKV